MVGNKFKNYTQSCDIHRNRIAFVQLFEIIPFLIKTFQAQTRDISHYVTNSQVGRVYTQIAKDILNMLKTNH